MNGEHRPPFPRWRRWAIGAVLAAVLGGVGWAYFDRLTSQRVADGVQVDAQVTDVWTIPVGKYDPPQLVTVSYRFGGATRSTRLMAPLFAENYRVGDVVKVYVEPDHPQRVATSDGLASEGLILLVPPAMVFYGIVGLLIVGVGRLRWLRRYEWAATEHVPILEINAMIEASASFGPWSRAIERLMDIATAESEGNDAELRMYLVYQVPESVPRRRPRRPQVVWYSRRRRRVTIEAWMASAEGADPQVEVVRVLQQALQIVESSAPALGFGAPVVELERVIRRTVDTYQSRPEATLE